MVSVAGSVLVLTLLTVELLGSDFLDSEATVVRDNNYIDDDEDDDSDQEGNANLEGLIDDQTEVDSSQERNKINVFENGKRKLENMRTMKETKKLARIIENTTYVSTGD